MTETIRASEINAALAGTAFSGAMHHFRTIDSTNTYALDEARNGAPHGSFYLADEQTAGRGRSGHQWHSEAAEGLYLSVLLRLNIAAQALAWLPLMAGLTAHAAIREVTGLEADLRWPNDLLLEDKKVAGILVETAGTAAVIGIGINLHQRSFPPSLATPATSLDLETGGIVSREILLIAFLKALDRELAAFTSGQASPLATIPSRIAAISSWVEGRRVEVHGPQACTGVTAGLEERGFLRVQTENHLRIITTGGLRASPANETHDSVRGPSSQAPGPVR